MTESHFYERQIYEAIASNIGISVSSLKRMKSVLPLPSSDYSLFQLLDLVPSASSTMEVSASTPRLSVIYGKMLNSMPDSLIVSMAQQNYAKTSHWLPADPQKGRAKTPIYIPTSVDVSTAVVQGNKLQYRLDSSSYTIPTQILQQSFPSMLVNQPFLAFNQTAANNRFNLNMLFESLASPTVRAGGWFSQGAFVSAYKSGGKGWKTGPNTVTWEELFGTDGSLQFICNGMLAISGITIALQCFGNYDQATLDLLQSSNNTTAWPFYLNVPNGTQRYELGTDCSITTTTVVPAPEVLLFLLTAAPVSKLTGTNT
jgi:hypothetical protein